MTKKSSKEFKHGDEVEWRTPQGMTTGKIAKRLTEETHVRGHKVVATPEDPQYLVKTTRSGKYVAYLPQALKKKS